MTEKDVGPLGMGHEPKKNPMQALSGMLSAVLILESITIFLSLTVILKVEDGVLWTPLNWGFVVALGTAHFILAFFQRFSWGLPAALVLQVIGLLGFFVHWSVGTIVVIYILVWWYALTLRKNMIERMRRGLLTTQHLQEPDGNPL